MTWHSPIGCEVSFESLMSPFSWQCQNLCLLNLAFIVDWRVVHWISFKLILWHCFLIWWQIYYHFNCWMLKICIHSKTNFIFNRTIYWIVSFTVTSMPCITKYTKHLWRIASSDSAATACLRMFPHIYLLSPYHSPEKRIEDDPNFLTFVCVCVNRNKKGNSFYQQQICRPIF